MVTAQTSARTTTIGPAPQPANAIVEVEVSAANRLAAAARRTFAWLIMVVAPNSLASAWVSRDPLRALRDVTEVDALRCLVNAGSWGATAASVCAIAAILNRWLELLYLQPWVGVPRAIR